jgi:hypothetical protein
LPGLTEGFIFEKTTARAAITKLTTAVWKDEEAFQVAKKAATSEFRELNSTLTEVTKTLKVEIEKATYRRSPLEFGRCQTEECFRVEIGLGRFLAIRNDSDQGAGIYGQTRCR